MIACAQLLQYKKRAAWAAVAAAAFVLTVADCLYRNRDADGPADPLFPQFIVLSAVSFASFACAFLFSRFYITALLIAAGGVCAFLFAPDLLTAYLFVSLPAILTVFLLRYCPQEGKGKPAATVACGVLAAAELAGIVYQLCTLIAANTPFLGYLLPFSKLKGRSNHNYYGFVLLVFLTLLFVFLCVRQLRVTAAHLAGEKKNGKNKKPAGTAPDPYVLLRFAAACLFFVSAALWCLQAYSDKFLPVPSFVNLAAAFVFFGAAQVPSPAAGTDSRLAEVPS